jgi:hypothetical protein
MSFSILIVRLERVIICKVLREMGVETPSAGEDAHIRRGGPVRRPALQ